METEIKAQIPGIDRVISEYSVVRSSNFDLPSVKC